MQRTSSSLFLTLCVLQALNKLIYVSGLVFGERQEAFLLPWKRVCGYSNESLIVAKRDQAKALFKNHMDAIGEGVPVIPYHLALPRSSQALQSAMHELSKPMITLKPSTRRYNSRLPLTLQTPDFIFLMYPG